MKQWTADFASDPDDDYNIIVEILYDDEDVAVIKYGRDGPEMTWYPSKEKLVIPVKWLSGLLVEAEKRILASREVLRNEEQY